MLDKHHSGSGMQNNYSATNRNINHIGAGGVVKIRTSSADDAHASGHRPDPSKVLWEKIAGVRASHNAEQQYQQGTCLEETRVVLLRMIYEWGAGQAPPLFWLTGAAGIGKTAIAMSAAKECERRGLLASSFFFYRNNPKVFVLTLAYDLISTMPISVGSLIERRISENRRILEARLEDQFRELILTPISESQCDESEWARFPNLVILDGLDETMQLRILDMIQDAFQHEPHLPLRFLICSRPELWIKEAFDAEPLRTLSRVILLDDAFEDIIKYCRHHFQKIISDPKYKHIRFPSPWPSHSDFGTLIEKSRSHFIYVETVFRLITHAGNHPVDTLRFVLANSPTKQPRGSPYPELDALYLTILEANSNLDEVHAILVAILVLSDHRLSRRPDEKGSLAPTPAHIEVLLGLPTGQVSLTLRGMHAVLCIGGWADEMRVYHKSFTEYLLDMSRSQKLYIDLYAQTHLIARQWLKQLTTSKMRAYR
ncbi:hypothetical protein PQX77_011257 [Marasmius sp. AFHP31]|nr:hypothetical protein PQX77_011257 [Marasmius sp. AFHP31]